MNKLSIILLSICLISSGCSKEENKKDAFVSPVVSSTAVNEYGYVLKTVKHDNHLFVIWASSDKVILHHPDCPCKSKN